jgi:hypothetical protein
MRYNEIMLVVCNTFKVNNMQELSSIGTGSGENYQQEYEDQATVKRLMMENNVAHFRLTEDTPPMQEPLLSEPGYLADTLAAEQILNGTYVCPPGTDSFTQDFLACMQHPPCLYGSRGSDIYGVYD